MRKIEDNIISQLEPLYLELGSAEKVSNKLGINPSTVVRYLKKLGYNFDKKTIKITIPYKDALKLYTVWTGSLTQFCKKYKICLSHFTKYLKQNGITVINYQNLTKFNEHIFDVIDTEEKAYWLGFIFADGYISQSSYKFELSLSDKDKDHLDKFNIFMQHIKDNVKYSKIYNHNKEFIRCRWMVSNKHLWETLNFYGCTPKKSLTLTFPNDFTFYNKSLIRHFIRGYFDGDGCISYANKDHTKLSFSILGTESFLNSLNLYLPNKLYMFKDKNTNFYELKASGSKKSKAFKILNYLYENSSIYLNRKYRKYLEYCRLYK